VSDLAPGESRQTRFAPEGSELTVTAHGSGVTVRLTRTLSACGASDGLAPTNQSGTAADRPSAVGTRTETP